MKTSAKHFGLES